jgi:hypothetical protein
MNELAPNGKLSQATRSLRTLLGDQRAVAADEQCLPEDECDRSRGSAEDGDAVAHGLLDKRVDRLLARAEARDAAGERRDRAAEKRDRVVGSLPEEDRQQAALDRIHAARDREWAAADRAELLAAHRSHRAGHGKGLERGVENEPADG